MEEREADSYEEDILEAAESLSDNEFQEFVEFYRDQLASSVEVAKQQGKLNEEARLRRERSEAIRRGEEPPEGYTRFGRPAWPPIDVNTAPPAWTDFRLKWRKEEFDSNWVRGDEKHVGSIDLHEIGRWALKLKSIGILQEQIVERNWEYKASDYEKHVDQDGNVREVTWWLSIGASHLELVDLVERVTEKEG